MSLAYRDVFDAINPGSVFCDEWLIDRNILMLPSISYRYAEVIPKSDSTNLDYDTGNPGFVKLSIYDILSNSGVMMHSSLSAFLRSWIECNRSGVDVHPYINEFDFSWVVFCKYLLPLSGVTALGFVYSGKSEFPIYWGKNGVAPKDASVMVSYRDLAQLAEEMYPKRDKTYMNLYRAVYFRLMELPAARLTVCRFLTEKLYDSYILGGSSCVVLLTSCLVDKSGTMFTSFSNCAEVCSLLLTD